MVKSQDKSPGLRLFLERLKEKNVDRSIEFLIELLSRRQIRGSYNCAIATNQLLRKVVVNFKAKDVNALLLHVRQIGQRLQAAQPRELVVGNMVRRVLGLIREVSGSGDDDADLRSETSSLVGGQDEPQRPNLISNISHFSPLRHGATEPTSMAPIQAEQEAPKRPQWGRGGYSSFAVSTQSATNLFGLLAEPSDSPTSTPTRTSGPALNFAGLSLADKRSDSTQLFRELKLDVSEGIKEILDEVEQASEQIAENAMNYINANDIILTHGGSQTIHEFLSAVAKKRKFTVFYVEGEPSEAKETRNMILHGCRIENTPVEPDPQAEFRPLIDLGVNVVLIPDSHVFAIMASVNKVVLSPHTVMANGGILANAGSSMIASAAQAHKVPVMVLSGVYRLSPLYPLDTDELREIGGCGDIEDSEGLLEGVDVVNPLWDYIEPEKINLYLTNIGAHAPSYLYRIVSDNYDREDVNLDMYH